MSMLRSLTRWTPLTFIAPARYVDRGLFWENFDLERWSREEYIWIADGWNGYRDVAQKPRQTIHERRGDCEDYALVAASWALSRGRGPVRLGFLWEKGKPHPTHAICYDESRTYSSGHIRRESAKEFLRRTDYDYCLGRLVK